MKSFKDPKDKPLGTHKPVQSVSYEHKVKDDNRWGIDTMEYYLRSSTFTSPSDPNGIAQNYKVYNNHIDPAIFNYVTNPLNTDNEEYSSFPAKIRSYNIIRPTIDLLLGEWNKKPFRFDVINTDGDDVFNSFLDQQSKAFKQNITQRIINTMNQEGIDTAQASQQIPDPATLLDDLNTNYKDLKAIKGYKALKILEHELKLKDFYKNEFKDWLIGGGVRTLKFPKRSEIEYSRLSLLSCDYDKSVGVKHIEDGEYATAAFRVTVADLVDMFYDELSEEHIRDLEEDETAHRKRLWTTFAAPRTISTANSATNVDKDYQNKVDLYYVCWKARKKIGLLSYVDPQTLEIVEDVVDEDYKVDKETESVEWIWVNEVWEGWRVNDDIYLGIRPTACQRTELNNYSKCKLPINGANFSDVEDTNISIVELGMPYQIMYIIMMYRIELMIAKSKGKILLLDKNVIPDDEEGGEDKFFYYSEALGYMLIDRSGDDVDRTLNQYTAIDMSLFDQIGQLIQLAQFFKDQWDELLGINRQRKGQNNASDAVGVNQESVFRSTVMSDTIFSTFDEWVESELQGLMDCTQFAWVDGKSSYYKGEEGRMELFNLEGEAHANTSYGVYVDSMSRTQDKLNLLKANINAVAQRKDIKLSTIADLIFSDSYIEITTKLKKAEAIEIQAAQQAAQGEQDAIAAAEQVRQEYEELKHFFNLDLMHQESDRLDNREFIKGEIEKLKNNGELDLVGLESIYNDRLDRFNKANIERAKITSKERIEVMKDITKNKEIAASLKNKVVGEK